MDFKSLLWLWIVIIGATIIFGGPVIAVISMFVAWLMPAIILGIIVLIGVVLIARSTDKE